MNKKIPSISTTMSKSGESSDLNNSCENSSITVKNTVNNQYEDELMLTEKNFDFNFQKNKNSIDTTDFNLSYLRERTINLCKKQKLKVQIPKLFLLEGNIVWTNFLNIAQTLKRDPFHLQLFVIHKLDIPAQIIEKSLLIESSHVSQSKIKNIVQAYSKEFVLCRSCKSMDTKLFCDFYQGRTKKICLNCFEQQTTNINNFSITIDGQYQQQFSKADSK